MSQETVIRARKREASLFLKEKALNATEGRVGEPNIATACENQCIHCNVNSAKLGRTRS